jgi:hypothetical protein
MLETAWTRDNGTVVINEEGNVVLCKACPCDTGGSGEGNCGPEHPGAVCCAPWKCTDDPSSSRPATPNYTPSVSCLTNPACYSATSKNLGIPSFDAYSIDVQLPEYLEDVVCGHCQTKAGNTIHLEQHLDFATSGRHGNVMGIEEAHLFSKHSDISLWPMLSCIQNPKFEGLGPEIGANFTPGAADSDGADCPHHAHFNKLFKEFCSLNDENGNEYKFSGGVGVVARCSGYDGKCHINVGFAIWMNNSTHNRSQPLPKGIPLLTSWCWRTAKDPPLPTLGYDVSDVFTAYCYYITSGGAISNCTDRSTQALCGPENPGSPKVLFNSPKC